MSNLYDLPDGWEWKKLGDLAEYINGMAFKPNDWVESGLPIIRIQNLNGSDDFNYFNGEAQPKYYVKDGDILISWSASLDVYKWNRGDAILNQHIFNTNINLDVVDYDFFYHTIKYSLAEIMKNLHGVGMKHITKGKFENIDIPLPPLSEQQRIVSKLDKLFEKIDKAIALHQKNMDEADVFIGSVLNDIFVELEEKYECKKLKDVVTKEKTSIKRGPFGSALKKSFFVESGYLVYEQYHALNNDFSMERYYIDEDKFNELKGFEVKGGDIIISCSGVYLGKLAIIPNDYTKGIINQALLKLSLNKEIISNELFVYFWNNLMNNGFFNEVKKGAAIPNMPSVKELKEIEIPIPPQRNQQKVVSYLDEISQKIEKIKQIQKEKMESLKALKASILDQAFRGEL